MNEALSELTNFCKSRAISEDGLQAIIEKHGLSSFNRNGPHINYKFFHEACHNAKSTEGIIRYLFEHFPRAVRHVDEVGRLPLHNIFRERNNGLDELDRLLLGYPKTKHVTPGMVQLLIDAFPDSINVKDNNGCTPLQYFCLNNKNLDEDVALEILKLIVKRYPNSVHQTDSSRGGLPICFAAAKQSPEFCRILIEAHPGSERMTRSDGVLPFHLACIYNTVATVEYFYNLYPESINVAGWNGAYPIHWAIVAMKSGNDDAIKIVQFLLDCDPNVALQEHRGNSRFPGFVITIMDSHSFIAMAPKAFRVAASKSCVYYTMHIPKQSRTMT